MPETIGLEPRERVGHGCSMSGRHDGIPVAVEGVDQFERRRNEILSDLPLGDQVHDGKQQERFVRGLMVDIGRIDVSILIRAQSRKFFQLFFKHGWL
mgnify:CR=1 FL=1